jgi:hypothetical protein
MDGCSMRVKLLKPAWKQTIPVLRVSGLMMASLAFACGNVLAQAAPEPKPAEPPKEAVSEQAVEAETDVQDSTEQGQVSLDESFTKTRRERIIEQRKKALEDTKADVQLRSYLLDRDKFDNSELSALALGGYAGFKTGYFRDRFAVGATVYTSQKLYGPEDKDGTGLLQPGQESYTVLGEIYGQFRFTDDIMLDIGRKTMNTPYINKSDTRMTPNTFESLMLMGSASNEESGNEWRFGFGYVDEMKARTSQDFVSMAEIAGAPDGVERGVYAGGANYKRGALSIGAVNYYSDDIINIFYTEAKYDIPLSEGYKIKLAAQYTAQDSAGDELLTGSSFSTSQIGVKAELAVGNALFTTAWNSNDDGADLVSPWGSIPSYNSVQVQDFNRAGEDSLLLRAGYTFKSMPSLSAYALWVNGSQPTNLSQSAQDEYDFNLQWSVSTGSFKGLSVRARYAVVTQDMGGPDLQDFRLIINYDPPAL